MTPQAARIDAHLLNHQSVTRLCYAGSVLRTKPDGLAQTREPIQLGAELFGHAGIESDIEIQLLLINALQRINIHQVHIDFSHVGIFESLVQTGNINPQLEQALYIALQSKDQSAVAALASSLDKTVRNALIQLTSLNGDSTILDEAAKVLPPTSAIQSALADLNKISLALAHLEVAISFDLSELRGYHYHLSLIHIWSMIVIWGLRKSFAVMTMSTTRHVKSICF